MRFLLFEVRHHAAVGHLLDALHLFVQPHGDAMVAQVVGQRLHHFGVGEFEQPRPLFHQDHAHAQDGEHAGVLDADHAAAHHDQGLGDFRHLQDLIAVDDVAAVDGDLAETAGLVPVAMMMLGASKSDCPRDAGDADVCGSRRPACAVDHVDAVAGELRLRDVDFGLDHVLHAEGEVRHGDLFLDPVVDAVDALVAVAGEVQHGFAHGLAGDGAGVDAGAADDLALLDDGHALAVLGALDGRPLAGRPRADHDEIVLLHAIVMVPVYRTPAADAAIPTGKGPRVRPLTATMVTCRR